MFVFVSLILVSYQSLIFLNLNIFPYTIYVWLWKRLEMFYHLLSIFLSLFSILWPRILISEKILLNKNLFKISEPYNYKFFKSSTNLLPIHSKCMQLFAKLRSYHFKRTLFETFRRFSIKISLKILQNISKSFYKDFLRKLLVDFLTNLNFEL